MTVQTSQGRGPLFDREAGIDCGRSSNAASELVSFGLTPNQARIYLHLLISGPSTPRMVSESLGIHRVDAYRNLHELEQLGILEAHLGKPKRYSPLSPKDALAVLVGLQQERVVNFKGRLPQVVSEIDSIMSASRIPFNLHEAPGNFDRAFRLGVGVEGYTEELRNLIKSSRGEILRIFPGDAIRAHFHLGVDDLYEKASERGASIRIITQIDTRNRAFIRRLSKWAQIRHLDGMGLRLTVGDRMSSLLNAGFQEDHASRQPEKNRYLVIDDKGFAEAFARFFDRLWDSSVRPA